MGLLDGLKRDKTSLAIHVDPQAIVPGAEVRIRVTVDGEIDDKAQGLRAGVRCLNRYLVRERDNDDDGNEIREVWRSLGLHEEVHELPVAAGAHEIACVVPNDALPSSEDAVVWLAWAQLDRRKGLDVKESAPFAVLLAADAVGVAPAPAALGGTGGVTFAEVPQRAAAGEELRGTLAVTPPEDLKVSGIDVKLRRVRTYSAKTLQGVDMQGIGSLELGGKAISVRDGGISIGSASSTLTKRDDVVEAEACGKQEFRGGDTAQVPFALTVPADAGPTVVAPHTVVTWEIEATVKRRLRGDYELAAPVAVFNAR